MTDQEGIAQLLRSLTVPDPSVETQRRLIHHLRQRHAPRKSNLPRRCVTVPAPLRVACGYATAAVTVWVVFFFTTPTVWNCAERIVANTARGVVASWQHEGVPQPAPDQIAKTILLHNQKLLRLMSDPPGKTLAQMDTATHVKGGSNSNG
ncbi:MAG: hypothetical protein COZ56_08005 [Armatimonadetes bacterium CG_4_8_14_3_um_filter_58_9]|nr:MAG: hypothetical protein COZ56_08005 [Armatimonadetes bacterium CG_4_8_14_3_um_filter_58_9]PJB74765.1 MAG: hypothetical protein CO095_04445 [Armatimonadetes bacterium CG_4_9_14_3_um_filter_58_7]